MEKIHVYFDMDGVLADFDRGVRELCNMEATSQNETHGEAYDDQMWDAIRKIDHFYGRLELMPGAREMFDLVYSKYGDHCEILTGVPKPSRGITTAGEDKISWMKRELSEEVKVNIVLRKEKIQFCTGPECVLIDDRADTIHDWQNAGGTGILHVSPEETIAKLESLGIL